MIATLAHDNKQPNGPIGLTKIVLGSVVDGLEGSIGALYQIVKAWLGQSLKVSIC